MKRIYLIDCPGVVPPNIGDSEEDILLRGVVRVENVENPAQYVAAVLRKTQTKHIERTYDMKYADYNDDAVEFLSILARKGGRLLKGAEPDVGGVAKMVLNDFLRGKIPWFTPPPKREDAAPAEEVVEGREGRLGEMPSKRKRGEEEDAPLEELINGHLAVDASVDEMDGTFEAFSDEEDAGVELGVSNDEVDDLSDGDEDESNNCAQVLNNNAAEDPKP